MTALVLTFVASFIGAALLIREAKLVSSEFRPWWISIGFVLLVVGWFGMLALLLRWAVS